MSTPLPPNPHPDPISAAVLDMLLAMCMDALKEGHLSQALLQLQEGKVRLIVVPETMAVALPPGTVFVQRKEHTN